MKTISLYDTTLRDGAQRERLSFSLADKLKITEWLDGLGIDFIEGGWPGSNPKDREYFEQVADLEKTINAVDCDAVVIGTPIDLNRIVKIDKPNVRVKYELQEIGEPNLEQLLAKFMG